ncbi:hypothetical protein BGZ76_002094, partial [Entomortierella beljakovae]
MTNDKPTGMSISQEFFNKLDNMWGPHKVDLFATDKNWKLDTYVSWKPWPTAFQ